MGEKNLLKKIEISLLKLDKWVRENGFIGYDKYDYHAWKIGFEYSRKYTYGKFFVKQIIKVLDELESVSPLFVRKLLRIKPSLNSKALGLFLYCNVYMFKKFSEENYLYIADNIISILNNIGIKINNSMGWGYPFPFQGAIYFPPNTPYTIVTSVVGDGLVYYWEEVNSSNQLVNDMLERIVNFFMFRLNKINVDDGFLLSFSPIDSLPVYNPSLQASALLYKVGKLWQDYRIMDFAIKLSKIPLIHFLKQGFLYYMPLEWHNTHIDNYHTGFNIRAFYDIGKYAEDEKYIKAAQGYYQFYIDNFIGSNGEPLRNPKGDYVESHSAAEAILLSAHLAKDFKVAREVLDRVSRWVINNMQENKGYFIYKVDLKTGNKVKIPYIRWSEAWMMRALVEAHKYLSKSLL